MRSPGCGRPSRARRRGRSPSRPAPGAEFVDWGGIDHLGGGSHGALHADDANGILVAAGLDGLEPREQWTLRDVLPLVLRHFGLN